MCFVLFCIYCTTLDHVRHQITPFCQIGLLWCVDDSQRRVLIRKAEALCEWKSCKVVKTFLNWTFLCYPRCITSYLTLNGLSSTEQLHWRRVETDVYNVCRGNKSSEEQRSFCVRMYTVQAHSACFSHFKSVRDVLTHVGKQTRMWRTSLLPLPPNQKWMRNIALTFNVCFL